MTRTGSRDCGARDEFDQFVATTADDLVRAAYLVVWDFPAAEDLVQEGLLRVAKRWHRVRSMDYPAAYARRIVINLALAKSELQQRHRSELGGDEALDREAHHDASAMRALDAVDTSSELLIVLAELPPRQRTVLALRYFYDLSEAQVADVLGCSIGNVKSTASRALARLRATSAGQSLSHELVPLNLSARLDGEHHEGSR